MPIPSYPQLSRLIEYGTAGGSLGAQDATTDMPGSSSCGRFLRVVDITTGAVVSFIYADNDERALTVVVGDEFRVDFIGVGANTTADVLQFGWE